jgi:hypothetical protein
MLLRLEDYEEEFPPGAALAAIPTLYKHSLKLREGLRVMFEFGADMALSRIVLRLMRQVPEVGRVKVVKEILSDIPLLTGKLDLIQMMGSDDGIGHTLLPDEDVRPLEQDLHDQVLASPASTLAAERDLLNILRWLYSRTKPPDEITTWLRERVTVQRFLVALLRSSLNELMSQAVGESAIQREDALPWDFLEAALSPEGIARVDGLSTEGLDQRSALAIEIAKKYRSGWRPSIGSRHKGTNEQDPMKKAAWPLFCGVHQQRLEAIEMLRQSVGRGADLPDDRQSQLAQIVLSPAYATDERVAVVDLLLAARKIEGVLKPLSQQWLSERGLPSALSASVSKLWFENPNRMGDLLNLFEVLPVNAQGKRNASAGIVDAYANLCNMTGQGTSAVRTETLLRARTIGGTFAPHPQLEQYLKKLNALIEGSGELP